MSVFSGLLAGQSSREIGRLLKGVIQKQINQNLTSTDIIDSENQTPVQISNSKDLSLVGDLAQQALFNISTEMSTNHYMTFEPDGVDTRLWLKFQNAGTLVDYAKQKLKAFSVGQTNLPGTFIHYNDDINVKYEVFSYFNGSSHFAYVNDDPVIQLKNIVDASKNFAIQMRMKPVSFVQSLTTENITIFSKVDDDQLRYGYSCTITPEGHMHFYIRKDYVQYHLFIKDGYSWILTDPLYAANNAYNRFNFNVNNFQTTYRYLCALATSMDLKFEDWIFNYKTATNQLYVILNGDTVMADTATVAEKPYMILPLQDGKWNHTSSTVWNTTVRDASGNAKNGTVTGTWGFTTDNELYNPGSNVGGTAGGCEVSFASNATVNTLTQFTVGISYKPMKKTNAMSYSGKIVSKGVNVNNSFWIEHVAGTSKIRANIRTSGGATTSVTSTTDLVENEHNYILFRWKSGENLKLMLNRDPEVQSTSTLSTTITNGTDNIKLLSSTNSMECALALFRFHTVQVLDTTAADIIIEGYHNPFFPEAESIQPVPDPDPAPITVPFTTPYSLLPPPSPIDLSNYRYINSGGGDSPYFQIYGCADGTSIVDPIVQRYDVDPGAIKPGVPQTKTLTVPSTDNSSNQLQRNATQNEIVGFRIQSFPDPTQPPPVDPGTEPPPVVTQPGAADQYGVRSAYGTGEISYAYTEDFKDGSHRWDWDDLGASRFVSCELIAYIRTSNPPSDEVTGVLGGGGHSDGSDPHSYAVGVDTDTGATRYRMEEHHPNYITGEDGGTGMGLRSLYVGYRFVKWNKPTGVQIEIWQDQGNNEGSAPANLWKKISSWLETDYNWRNPPSDHQETLRIDGSNSELDDLELKWLSLREIKTTDTETGSTTGGSGTTLVKNVLSTDTRTLIPIQFKLPDNSWSDPVVFNCDTGASFPTDVPLEALDAFGYDQDGTGSSSQDTLDGTIRIVGLNGEYDLPIMVQDKAHYDLLRSDPDRYPLLRIRDLTELTWVFTSTKTTIRISDAPPPELQATPTTSVIALQDMASRAGTPTTGWQWQQVKFSNPTTGENATDWFGINTGDLKLIMKKSLGDSIHLPLTTGRNSENWNSSVSLEFMDMTPPHATVSSVPVEVRIDSARFGRGGSPRNFGGGLPLMSKYSICIYGGIHWRLIPSAITTNPAPALSGGVDQFGVKSVYATGQLKYDWFQNFQSGSWRWDFEDIYPNFVSCELTGYYAADDTWDDEVSGKCGGGHHADGSRPQVYDMGVGITDGATRYRTEDFHPTYTGGQSGPNGSPLKTTYTGYKFIKWNKGTSSVLLEIWQDTGNNEGSLPANQWVKVASWNVTDPLWLTPKSDHQETIRIDGSGLGGLRWKWLSLREIKATDTPNPTDPPPVTPPVTPPPVIPGVPQGIGDELLDKAIKSASFWLQGGSTPTGTVYCRIWDQSNTAVATLGSVNASSISTSDFQKITFTNTSNELKMKDQYVVGVEYKTGSTNDYVKVHRRGTNYDSTITQASKFYNGEWKFNDAFETRFEVTYTYITPDTDPYFTMGSTPDDIGSLGEVFDTGSAFIGIPPTHAEFRVYRDVAVAGGTVKLNHLSNTGELKGTLKSIDATTLPTAAPTTFNFVWENLNYNSPITAGDRLVINVVDVGTNAIYVMSNSRAGTIDDYDTTKSCLVYYDNTTGWTTDTTLDISGKMASGGNSFDAFERFSETKHDIGLKIVNAGSVGYNRRITRVIARAKKVGTPSGTITCGIMDVNYRTKVILGVVDASTVSTGTYGDMIFSNPANIYNTQEGDKVFIRYFNGTATNTVELNMGRDFVDGLNTIAFYIDGETTFDVGMKDLAGRMYIGGDLDVNSRSRIVQSIERDESILKGRAFTRIILYLYRTTTATSGTAYVNIRRGTDDQVMSTIGTVAVSTLGTDPQTPTPVVFENLANTYVTSLNDKVSFEFSGGNTTNRVGVLVRDIVIQKYDFANSYIKRYNEVAYVDPEPQWNLVGQMLVGGYTYTPEPNAPPSPTAVADKDLIFCGGRNKASGFFEALLVESRIYSREITLDLAANLYTNKYTILPIGVNEVLMGFTWKPAPGGGP